MQCIGVMCVTRGFGISFGEMKEKEFKIEELDLSEEAIKKIISLVNNPPEMTQALRKLIEEYSGQFRIRIPRTLHAWLAAEAKREGVSQNTLVTVLLENARGQREAIREKKIDDNRKRI